MNGINICQIVSFEWICFHFELYVSTNTLEDLAGTDFRKLKQRNRKWKMRKG